MEFIIIIVVGLTCYTLGYFAGCFAASFADDLTAKKKKSH